MTTQQMVQKLVDFHTERINRVYANNPIECYYKLNDFSIKSYAGKSRAKIQKEYDQTFAPAELVGAKVEIQSTLTAA